MAPALNRFYTGDCLKVMDRGGGGGLAVAA